MALKTAFATIIISTLAGSLNAQDLDHSNMDHAAHIKMMADAQRQADVAGRGKDVMPFSLAATTHIFTKSAAGGSQRVVAKKSSGANEIELIRQHLQEIRLQFLTGDFSGPSHIHGQNMPGLSDLKLVRPGQIDITYKAVKGGAELTYNTLDPSLVAALRRWFDAQLADHGEDATQGRSAHEGMPKQ
jgi:hypothetical protein